MELRKIPLEMLIQILQELYDGGADFVDISGKMNGDGESLRDSMKITVKPEYLSDYDEEDTLEQEIQMDFDNDDDDESSTLSENDIEDLI